MDLNKCVQGLKDTIELLIVETEYFENRVNSKTVTKDDKDCIVEDIQDCRKILATLMTKVKGIAIIKSEGRKV